MSGHSKWHQIKHKKGIIDAKRGKIFTQHAKIIYIAARKGGADPAMNPSLRTAILNAKADNLPNANIEKALNKASGSDKDASNFEEIFYEGFGPFGVVFYIHVITDNKNRSLTNIKSIFTKQGGNLGAEGSVGWMFEKMGLIIVNSSGKIEEDCLKAIDAGAQDVSIVGDELEILTEPVKLSNIRENLEKENFVIKKAEISFVPKSTVLLKNIDEAKQIMKILESLEDDEDVSNVYYNFEIPDEIADKL